jgi:hypothetical protein
MIPKEEKEGLAQQDNEVPREGFSTRIEILRVVDADTFEVLISRKFKVRLSHPHRYKSYIFDTPEKNTKLGRKAIRFVKRLFNKFSGIIRLFVPAGEPLNLMDSSSLHRINGEIWLDNQRLTDVLLESGYGRIISKSKRTSTKWEKSRD